MKKTFRAARKETRTCPCCAGTPCRCEKSCLCQELKTEAFDEIEPEDGYFNDDLRFSLIRHGVQLA